MCNCFFANFKFLSVACTIMAPFVFPHRVPEDYWNRRSLELVEVLREHPRNPNQILIGYSRGLVVLWDLINKKATHHLLGNQVLVNSGSSEERPCFLSLHSKLQFCVHPN